MSKLLQAIGKDQSKTTTENGMRTFSTSMNANLDLFFMGGAYRKRTDADLIALFSKAYYEDKKTALQLLAYIRDCRGGMGERRFFRTCIKHLADNGADFNVHYIPEIGRWDDLFSLFGTTHEKSALELIQIGLNAEDGLCAKWMPRKGNISRKIAKYLNLDAKEYRQLIVALTKVVETQMCNKEWVSINYSHVSSVANVKYNKAFLRNDEVRRRDFLSKAVKGEIKINSSVVFPHDIIKMLLPINGTTQIAEDMRLHAVRNDAAIAMWNQLPNWLADSNVNILPICDTSGSMNGLPLMISIALGLYISERSNGIFKDGYITFSKYPKLQYIKGNIYERITQMTAHHPSNTNLEATFELILGTAIKNDIKSKEMPTHLLIISDMEFDTATRSNQTALKMIKSKYKESGYEMPNIIFWNVNSRSNNVPIRFDKDGVGLVSGASPAVIQAILGGNINPIDIMMRAIDKEKYLKFVA